MALAASPIPPEAEIQGVGNNNALLLFDLSCDLRNESDWNSMHVLQCIQCESAVIYLAKEVP